MAVEVRRDVGRGFFESLEKFLDGDEFLADRASVRLLLDKAEQEHQAQSRKRFDREATFRQRILYSKIDDFIAAWCRRRDVRADPFKVFRYGGSERGPTQHETAIGPSMPYIERAFERLKTAVPEIADCSAQVLKAPTKVIAPAFRLQHPLPFGACGEVKYGGDSNDLARAIYLTAMHVATRGDVSRNWSYDCGVLIFYGGARPRQLLGDSQWESWPETRRRIWDSGRLWPIVL
ncbi:MAG TPA: hypothetical protein VEB21_00145 [Terriglobales bacterium]|nr:hypothetical protein [Terriglobales bacterium]